MSDPLADGISLRGKVAIVTGGSRGLGRSIALAYARAGALVAAVSRSHAGSQQVVDEIVSRGGAALAIEADLGRISDLDQIIQTVLSTYSSLDILVNCAALMRFSRIEDMTHDLFEELYSVNVRGPVYLAQAALPHLKGSGSGVIVNVLSNGAFVPEPGLGAYCSSKAAMMSWTQIMAQEWGKYGIRVNALVPGPIATDMILPKRSDRREPFLEALGKGTLVGRVGVPEDFDAAALFLASEHSSYMTGRPLILDGGISLTPTPGVGPS